MGSFLPIILFVALALISSSSKKKAQEKQQQAQRRTSATLDEMESAPRRYAPAATPQLPNMRAERPARMQSAPTTTMKAAPVAQQGSDSYSPITHSVQTQGSLDYTSSEGEVSAYSAEGDSAYNDTEAVRPSIENGSGHVVHVSFESDHAHVESSTTGFLECPPEQKQDENYALPTERVSTIPTIGFGREDIRRAIVYSEIFSKPRALRR